MLAKTHLWHIYSCRLYQVVLFSHAPIRWRTARIHVLHLLVADAWPCDVTERILWQFLIKRWLEAAAQAFRLKREARVSAQLLSPRHVPLGVNAAYICSHLLRLVHLTIHELWI